MLDLMRIIAGIPPWKMRTKTLASLRSIGKASRETGRGQHSEGKAEKQ
jgi:hypothetical protein